MALATKKTAKTTQSAACPIMSAIETPPNGPQIVWSVSLLEQAGAGLYCGRRYRSTPQMLALYIILGFVAVLAAINFIEFGRVD